MSATIIERQENSVTIQVTIPLSRSMLDTEEAIQQALNQAGVLASAEALKQFDTDGSPLLLGSTRFTSKGSEPKTYQTPYGAATVARSTAATDIVEICARKSAGNMSCATSDANSAGRSLVSRVSL